MIYNLRQVADDSVVATVTRMYTVLSGSKISLHFILLITTPLPIRRYRHRCVDVCMKVPPGYR